MRVDQGVKILGVEHQQPGLARRGHRAAAFCLMQQRDLAEERAVREPHLLVRQRDLDLAGGDEIHRRGRIAPPHQYLALLDGARPQQPHDVGDLGCREMREQRHPRQHAPGDDEIAPLHLLGKGGRDDRDRQRDHGKAADDGEDGDELSERRHRHDVAIADGAERHDRPPHRLRNGAELVRLHVALDGVEQRGKRQDRADQDDDAADQRPPLGMHGREQRAHRRRIADQLEERQHAERGQRRMPAGGQHDRRGQERQEIDDAERGESIAEPVGERRGLARRMARHRPQPRGIFQREHDRRKGW